MLALYRCGRQSDALAAYRDLHTLLDTELGIAPSPPLQQLQHAVLTQDADLDWRPTVASVTVPAADLRRENVARDRAEDRSTGSPVAVRRPDRRGQRWLLPVAALAAAVVIGGASALLVSRAGRSGLASLPANSVGALHTDGSLHDAVTVGQSPDGLAYGAGGLWATSTTDNTVSRIDPRTHTVVQTIPVGTAPTAVTVTGPDVWVANGGDGTVSRINTASNTVVRTLPVGTLPAAIASGPSGVWVANSGDGTIQRIDPVTGAAGPPIPVGDGPDGIAVDEHTVWVANSRDGTVSPVDPATRAVDSPVSVGAGAQGIAATPDGIWVADAAALSVSRIDPGTRRVVATIPVGDGPTSIVAGSSAVWVGNEYGGTVTEIDPATNHARRSIVTGASPRGLALVGTNLWLASDNFTSSGHVGGTLTIVTATGYLPGSQGIDPATAYDTPTDRAQSLIYDGLVGFRRTGGIAGLTLVPDLAMTLPRPTNGGLTYTFTLRPGIRYSTGAQVQPDDIRRGVQRALLGGGNPGYYAEIVGGRHCTAQPASCDLTGGVMTDQAARRVTFHLTSPDPDFLDKLAWFVYPTPAGTPTTNLSTPLPGTGPYMISGYQNGEQQFTLTRNPDFRQWSYAAQPAGYPNVIRWQDVRDLSTQVADVAAGRADIAPIRGGAGPAQIQQVAADLANRYPAQLHPDLFFQTVYEFLNTQVPPFNKLLARQAVNFAVDRSQLVDIFGGPTQAAPTCQFLPPAFPGYQAYCPYTRSPSASGRYQAPDLDTGRRLVNASGTAGMKITVFGVANTRANDIYFVALLNQLGYHAALRELTGAREYGAYVLDSRHHAQIGLLGWGSDFPAPSNFFDPNLSCAGFIPANGADNQNGSEYCNPHVDQLAGQARVAQITDPATSRRLWAQVDRMVTNDAAVVATVNGKIDNFVATRLRNFQSNPQLGPLLDQMWVQ